MWGVVMSLIISSASVSIIGFLCLAVTFAYLYLRGRKLALRESEQKFREILENIQLVTVSLDNSGKVIFCNDFLLKLTGWEKKEVIGQNWIETFIPPESRVEAKAVFLEEHADDVLPACNNYTCSILTKQGNLRTVSWKGTFLWDTNRSSEGRICFGENVSDRRQAEEVFKRYELLSRHASDFIIFFRRDGEILEANEAIIQMYGYTRSELLAMKISDLRAPMYTADLEEKLSEAEVNGVLYETVHQRKDRTTFPVEVSLQGTVFEGEKVLFGIIRDISERRQAEERINHLAYHDPLTDLPNRILFYDRLSVALANARRNSNRAAVMFLDLDRFKIVNDMMGHSVGDRLLSEVGKLLASSVRADDTVGRLGGDEFTILLPIIKREEDAAIVARKIVHAFRKPWILEGREFQITASIGIALYPNDGRDPDMLTQSADTAMYRAKEHGDNYQFFTPVMNVRALERMELEISLRKALEQQEFEVYYQPQFDSRSRQIIGVEGLLRWHHPKKGMVMPGEFISITEETGLIVPIGEWVLRTACQQHILWQRIGCSPTRVAVNISAYQFRQKNFVEMVARVLWETGMDPTMLELEITESAAMQDADFTSAMLKRLSDMGIRIAIDDFGTGYSSLSYLRRFPISTLKVDQSFVRDVLSDPEDASIVSAIIVLARNLKLNVIVEGVENQGQLEFFERHRCFEMQGYFFSRPEPANVIEKLLAMKRHYLEEVVTYS